MNTDFITKMKEHHHKQVTVRHDEHSGMTAIIAIHDDHLGPASGGTRMYPYVSHDDAMQDALDLSRTMTMKCAAAELPFGGGKGVIIGNPATDKSEALFQAYGRFVADHSGKFVTGCDVGTNYDDLRIVQQEAPKWVSGLEPTPQGEDAAWLTAVGVMRAMQAALNFRNGSPSLVDKTIAVQGYGKVGSALSQMLTAANAVVYVSDTNPAAIAQAKANGRNVVTATIIKHTPCDIFAPCAMGGVVDMKYVAHSQAKIICGSANNPLADNWETVLEALAAKDITYIPDFIANAGGVIHATRGAVPHPDGMTIHNEVKLIGPRSAKLLRDADAAGRSTAAQAMADILSRLTP